jgi:hypothetical protein
MRTSILFFVLPVAVLFGCTSESTSGSGGGGASAGGMGGESSSTASIPERTCIAMQWLIIERVVGVVPIA